MLNINNSTAMMESNSSREAPFTNPSWIATQVYVGLLDLVFIYVLVRMIQYKLSRDSLYGRNPEPRMSSSKVVRERMVSMCIMVAILDILYAISTQIYLIHGWHSQSLCQSTIYAAGIFYGSSEFFTFVFLWWRQRVLYGNKLLKHLFTKVTQVLSWISIVGIAIAIFIPTLSQVFWRKYELTSEGCTLENNKISTFKLWYILHLSAYCVGQALLLGLYVHPLILHRKITKEKNKKRRLSHASVVDEQNKARFRDCILRSVTLTAISVVFDIMDGVAVGMISDRNKQRWLLLIPHHFYAVVNLICMICCFTEWRNLVAFAIDNPKYSGQHGERKNHIGLNI